MLGAQEIKLIEESSWLQEAAAIAGPFVVALAAIAAAVIAWKSAVSRLRHELQHEREMRRDEYRRDALDSTLEIVNEVSRNIQEFSSTLGLAESDLKIGLDPEKDGLEGAADTFEELRERSSNVSSRFRELEASTTRLRLRFGVRHDIPQAVEKLRELWQEQMRTARSPVIRRRPRTESKRKLAEQKKSEAAGAHADLLTACEEWLGKPEH